MSSVNYDKKPIIILIAIALSLSFPISAASQFVIVEFIKHCDGQMAYTLVFKRGEEIIAKRICRNGKNKLTVYTTLLL